MMEGGSSPGPGQNDTTKDTKTTKAEPANISPEDPSVEHFPL